MLSPDPSHQELPGAPSTPTPIRPHSAAAGYGSIDPYSYGAPPPRSQSPYRYIPPPSHTPVAGSSARGTPDPSRGYPVRSGTAHSSSLSSLGRPKSRSASADFGVMGGFPDRSRSPAGRPSSAHPSQRPPSARPITPGQAVPMAGYPDVTPPVPMVLRSPSRPSSRQSFSQEAGVPAARPASRSSAGDHHRSLSLHAGSTPAMFARPLSGSSQVHRVPSVGSINSETSRKSGGFQHYDPNGYVDPAFLASSEDLTSMASPNTMANTMANTRGNAVYTAGPSKLRSSSPSMSYASFRS